MVLSEDDKEVRHDLFERLFQPELNRNSPSSHSRPLRSSYAVPTGISKPFCNIFGCRDCIPPPGVQCCEGFLYDQRSGICRKLYDT
ncbi:hypothetical protein TNCT_148381 [Trichonephila clavata]|uniref:Uncharacterized protein n=1 Tax=Trichonephila clavata TaxID=2740835 RepID=A0A8X6LHJ1_TRICU|nr:hypothetical protein TNCT_148381 [Trichonephila clavata]